MNTSKTSTVSLESILIGIIEIVASSSNETVEQWSKENSIVVHTALSKLQGYCELTVEGEDAIRTAFSQLADAVDIPEAELISYLLFSN